jgi:hypothetical protein
VNIDALEKLLGIVASIIAILAFFGIGRAIDLGKILPRARPKSLPSTSPPISDSGILSSQKRIFGSIVGGGVGGVITGFIYNGAFQSIFYPILPINTAILGAVSTGIIWAVGMPIGAAAQNATEGVIRDL